MRTFDSPKLGTIQDAATRDALRKITDYLRSVSGALAKSVFPGQQPPANPVPSGTSSTPSPPNQSVPQPVHGDLLYGLNTGTWAKLPIGASGAILSVSGGTPAWATALSLLPTHDHSNAAQGGNIPETSITDGSLLARLAADEVVTGNWTAGNAAVGSFTIEESNSGGFDSLGLILFSQSTGFKTKLTTNSLQAADIQVTMPVTDAQLIGTQETTTVLNKTLSTGTKIRTGTATTFQDPASTTKQMQFDLSGISVGTTRSKVWQNIAGTIYESGGTDVAVADGGTGASTLTDRGVVIGRGTAAVDITAAGSTNTVLRGQGASANPDFGTISASYIDNRTRTVFLPATVFASGNTTDIVGTPPNALVGILMTNGIAAEYAQTTMVVPQDFVTSGAVSWKVLYTNGGTSNNGTHWDVYYQVVSDLEDMTGTNDSSMGANDSPGTTLDGLNIFEVGTDYSGLVAGRVLRVTVSRNATNGGDTNTSDMYFIGLQLDYTADM